MRKNTKKIVLKTNYTSLNFNFFLVKFMLHPTHPFQLHPSFKLTVPSTVTVFLRSCVSSAGLRIPIRSFPFRNQNFPVATIQRQHSGIYNWLHEGNNCSEHGHNYESVPAIKA